MTNRHALVFINGIPTEMSATDTILGNVSGSAATVTGATQSAITSTGTLTTGQRTSVGGGVGTGGIVTSANVQYTPVGNITTAETDLMSYTLPANSLSAGKAVRISAWGTGANNANAKTINVYIGGTIIASPTLLVSAAGVWRSEILFLSSGSGTQAYFEETIRVSATSTDVAGRVQGTMAKTDTADIIIKYTGTATATNDITQNGMIVEFLN